MRGRPPTPIQHETPIKFTRKYEDDICTEIWTYDLNKSNSVMSVDIKYKNNIDKDWDKIHKMNKQMAAITRRQKDPKKKIPITQQKWINPANGKEVSLIIQK